MFGICSKLLQEKKLFRVYKGDKGQVLMGLRPVAGTGRPLRPSLCQIHMGLRDLIRFPNLLISSPKSTNCLVPT